MSALLDLCHKGGPVMVAIIGLSVLLYARCFQMLLWLRTERRTLRTAAVRGGFPVQELQRQAENVHEAFRQQRVALGAMIAAAPLLGLLGTVSGMAKTFESLSSRAGEKSMEGLAQGISEVLVATESGLAVAIPALLLVYLAHRIVHRTEQELNQSDVHTAEGARP